MSNKNIIFPSKPIKDMTDQDWFEFRNTLDPDLMGFDEEEHIVTELFIEDEPACFIPTNVPYIIKDNLTPINFTNRNNISRIKYIVVHYTAGNGDSAWANTTYFKNNYAGASAHYFVDENPVIYRCVKDEDVSWHCGGGLQGSKGHSFYKICTNSNSIGIEMCSRKYSNGTYYFKQQTINNCILLVQYLMKKYNVPLNNVIRHYDVTGKICPAPFVNDASAWKSFKNSIANSSNYVVEDNKPGLYKVVNCDELNVRTGNSTNNEIIGELSVNTTIKVIEIKDGWGKIKYNNKDGWISLSYLEFVSKLNNEHWAQTYLNTLVSKKYITDISQWNNFDKPLKKDLVVALIDKVSGGTWKSNEANKDIHWAQPNVISLCGKGIITDSNQWIITLENNITKALLLALVDKMTGGTLASYTSRFDIDHWGRNCLDSLCDKAIINTPSAWTDFETEVSCGAVLALICKAIVK